MSLPLCVSICDEVGGGVKRFLKDWTVLQLESNMDSFHQTSIKLGLTAMQFLTSSSEMFDVGSLTVRQFS